MRGSGQAKVSCARTKTPPSRLEAYSKAANMSFLVSSGKSDITSSGVIPEANIFNTSSTLIRIPRIVALPPLLPASIVISFDFFIFQYYSQLHIDATTKLNYEFPELVVHLTAMAATCWSASWQIFLWFFGYGYFCG